MDEPSATKRAICAKRGGSKAAVWRIEGANYTYSEIAKILGISVASAKWRMRVLHGASGSVTIERLRALGS